MTEYRLLSEGEVIEAADECFHGNRWQPVSITIGAKVKANEVAYFRRPLPAKVEGTNGRVAPEGYELVTEGTIGPEHLIDVPKHSNEYPGWIAPGYYLGRPVSTVIGNGWICARPIGKSPAKTAEGPARSCHLCKQPEGALHRPECDFIRARPPQGYQRVERVKFLGPSPRNLAVIRCDRCGTEVEEGAKMCHPPIATTPAPLTEERIAALTVGAPCGPGLVKDNLRRECPSCHSEVPGWEARCRYCAFGAKPVFRMRGAS